MFKWLRNLFKKEDGFHTKAISRIRGEQIADNAITHHKLNFSGYSTIRASKISAQTIVPMVWTKVLFSSVTYDRQTEYEPVSSVFTAREAGLYMVSSAVQWSSQRDNNKSRLAAYKNGKMFAQIFEQLSVQKFSIMDTHISSGMCTVELLAGETISIYCYTQHELNIQAGLDISFVEITRVR